MNGRTISRLTVAATIVALASGCAGIPSFRRDPIDWSQVPSKSNSLINDNPSGGPAGSGTGYAPNGYAPNGVLQAGGVGNPASQPLGSLPQVPEQPGAPGTLAPPRPLAPDPMAPPVVPGVVPPTPGVPGLPGAVPGLPAGPLTGAKPNDPNVLKNPTVLGSAWALKPNETPMDRVVDLTQQLAAALAQNRDLLARIRELEAQGLAREQALREAVQEVETATGEVAKTRAAFVAMRSEIAALQKTVQQMEKDEIDTLKMVIEALKKLLAAQRREP